MRVYFAATFALIQWLNAPAQTQKGGAISGIVTNRATGEPIRKAEVTVLDSHDAFGISITDSEGRFQVSSLPPGEYRVRVFHQGFERAAYGSRGPDRPGKIVTLAENEVRAGVPISLLPLGVITGVVLDEDGDPLPHAQVHLFRSAYHRGKQRLEPRNTAFANERGEYRFYNLQPGRFYLKAEPQNGPVIPSNRAVTESAPSAVTVLDAFYPSSFDVNGAEALAPIPGKELRGVDIRLRSRPAARLKGRLALPVDMPQKGQWSVQLVPLDIPGWNNRGFGGELPTDTFEDTNIEPGKHTLLATLTAEGRSYRGVQQVDLASGADHQVTVALQSTTDISGGVQVEGPSAGKYRRFQINLVPGDGIPYNDRNLRAATNGDLHFKLSGVPAGVWDIGVEPIPEGGFLKSMSLGDQDVLTEDMVIGPKSPTNLKIVISTQGAKLEGDLEGDPLKDGARATILLAPTGKFSRVQSFFHSKVTDAKGHFSLDGLRPGQYNLFAFEDMASDAYQDPEFLKPFAKWAHPVELREGQTASAKPRLIPASLMNGGRE